MDEATDKKVRALKLKVVMAERELHASSGKWKLGALLKAGHADAMNREVSKVTERLEAKIAKLRDDITALTGESAGAVKAAPEPAAKAPSPRKVPAKSTAKSAAKSTTKAAAKKTPGKK
ncbi:MAG: hypothetical protein IPG71_05335 [bacterium]|nr:hypothetical protein [bacterium]